MRALRRATARCAAWARSSCSGDAQTPLAERPIKVADRLAAHLLGGAHGRARPRRRGCAWSRSPRHDPGRDEARRGGRRRCSRARATLPGRARRPGRRGAASRRPTAARSSSPTSRDLEQPRRDGRGRADRRARGPPARLRGARGPRARPSARRLLRAIERAPRARRRLPRPRAARRSRSATARCCWSRPPPPTLRRAPAGLGATSPAPTDTRDVAAKFRLSIDADRRGRRGRRGSPRPRAAQTRPSRADLDLGARQASSSRLGELAARLPPGYRWDDLVVPERQRELLQLDLAPTCATATACSPTGATRRPSRAPRA